MIKSISRIKTVRKYRNFLNMCFLDEKDYILASYPKSGNTWLKMMLVDIVYDVRVDFDSVDDYCPGVEEINIQRKLKKNYGKIFVKTHEMRTVLPNNNFSIICLWRRPEKVILSYFNHYVREGRFNGDFSEFFEALMSGKLDGYGSWQENLKSYVDYSEQNDNCIFVDYDQLVCNTEQELTRVLQFSGLSSDNLSSIISRYNIKNMSRMEKNSNFLKSKKINDIPFVRSSSIQSMSLEQVECVNRECADLIERLVELSKRNYI